MKGLELWHMSSRSSELKEVSIKKPGKEDVLVKSLFSFISTGTERIVSRGMVPASLMDNMRVPYMKGDFAFPCTYGYSLVGEIIEGSDAYVGKKVHVLHPHQNYAVVSVHDLYLIPDKTSLKVATLASNMETAVNGAWDSGISIGDKIMIVGFGIIGSLLARLLSSYPHIDLTVVEQHDYRCHIASKLGFSAVRDDHDLAPVYDIAFNCSGTQEGLQMCIDKLAFEGKAVEMSWYGDQRVSLHLGDEFHINRKQIISSQVSRIPGHKLNRWNHARRKELVFEILKDPYFENLIPEEVSFEKTPALFDRIRNNKIKSLGVMITY